MTASQPAMALRNASTRIKSPWTVSAASPARFSSLLVGRTRMRKSAPRRESSCATWLPTNPVAPVRKIFRPMPLLQRPVKGILLPGLEFCPDRQSKGAPYLARFSRDVGYTAADLPSFSPSKVAGRGLRLPHLAKNVRDTRISCTQHQPTATCAAFIEESRMKFINANKLHRKSGGPSLRNEGLALHNPQLARRPATGMLLRQVAAVPWRRYTLGREPIHAN